MILENSNRTGVSATGVVIGFSRIDISPYNINGRIQANVEKESRISYEGTKGLVEAMSEVAERLVPGMSLFCRERLLRRGSRDGFDSKEIAAAKTRPDGDAVPAGGADPRRSLSLIHI